MFAIYAFSMGSVFPRMGDIQSAMGIEKDVLGLALIGTPVGTLVSLTFAAPLIQRIGLRRVVVWGLPLLAILYAVAVHAPSPAMFFCLLIPIGLAIGCIETVLNLEADRTEHLLGYRIMNRCHAFWSIGFFVAGGFGALLASLGISPQVHLTLVATMAVAAVIFTLLDFQPTAKRLGENFGTNPYFATPTVGIVLLVAVTGSAMLLEGASMDWSAIYMRDIFHAGPFLSGIAVAAFAVSQATARFFADRVVDRYSPAFVARVLLVILFIGCLGVVTSPAPVLSLLSFAAMGVGTSAIFPLAVSAAAQRQDRQSVVNVASLAQLSFMMFLIGPPLMGFLAEHWGIRESFVVSLPLILLGLITSGALGSERQKA